MLLTILFFFKKTHTLEEVFAWFLHSK